VQQYLFHLILPKDFLARIIKNINNFYIFLWGSCSEVITQIVIAVKLKYINNAESLLNEIDEISKMIMGLIKKLDSND